MRKDWDFTTIAIKMKVSSWMKFLRRQRRMRKHVIKIG